MNELIVKDVQFNGAILKAAQDKENVVWVGVRWVCEGIGLSDGQVKRERKRLQDDLVISKGDEISSSLQMVEIKTFYVLC